ncbi:MAG: hypothetical protein CMD22_02800 [Flavobacteriales bacterium]|nr:hypothetical protein [Flavobacteriales bacterium]
MKNNNIYLFYFMVISLCFYSCRNEKVDHKDFAISNTEEVTKIIMSDKSGNKIEIDKGTTHWTINKQYKVWERQIDYTLGVMKDIRVKSSVSEQKMNYVIKNIATSGVKVEIFNKDGKVKSYYLGGNTPDYKGTYMIMEGSETAYILHIPDRNPGILNPKFGIEGTTVNENVWRQPIVIDYSENTIQQLYVKDIKQNDQSFKLDFQNISLHDYKEQEIPFNKANLSYWNFAFNNLKCGAYKPNLKTSNFNLIKKIYITTNTNTDSLFIFDKTEVQSTKKEYNPTVEYKYASYNNSELVIIQSNIFNKVLITLEEFLNISREKTQSL